MAEGTAKQRYQRFIKQRAICVAEKLEELTRLPT